jgi:hypothetical protein
MIEIVKQRRNQGVGVEGTPCGNRGYATSADRAIKGLTRRGLNYMMTAPSLNCVRTLLTPPRRR